MRHRLRSRASAILLLLFVFLAGPAQAHPGHDGAATFWSGLLHPLTGLDHLVAMLAVGLWSAFGASGPTARSALALPLLFVGGAILGTALGLTGALDGRIEMAVTGSLIALGAALLVATRAGRATALLLVALCGLLHGGAHGRELAASFAGDALFGFLLGTGLLHALGAALMALVPAARRRLALAGAGGGLAVTGLWLLA